MSIKEDLGILPNLETLKASFTELISEFDPVYKADTNEKLKLIFARLDNIYAKMQPLPSQVQKSYELIQMVINSIHSSRSELKKSVDGLIKKTGAQLQKVTTTTEDATHKIMDVAESLDEQQVQILDLLEQLPKNETTTDLLEKIKEKIYQNQDAAFTIIDYLQFQDITAQQIAGAYALLADTEKTLVMVLNMLKRFDMAHDMGDNVEGTIDRNSFNEDAKFSDKTSIQNAIDDLFKTKDTNIEIPKEKTDEAELREINVASTKIDDFTDDDFEEITEEEELPEAEEKQDQDDIDALFSTKKKEKGPAEDFDIDALFKSNKKG